MPWPVVYLYVLGATMVRLLRRSKTLTKSEAAIVVSIGTASAVHGLVYAASAADPAIPTIVYVIGLIGTPFVALLVLIAGLLHIGNRVNQIEVNVNSKMDALVKTTRDLADAMGYARGRDDALKEAQDARDQHALREQYRDQGAATERATHPQPPPTADPPAS